MQVLQLREQVAALEGRNASLQADLASAQATAGDAATAAVAVGDLRRQLDERSREVVDLTAISIKAGGVAGEQKHRPRLASRNPLNLLSKWSWGNRCAFGLGHQ